MLTDPQLLLFGLGEELLVADALELISHVHELFQPLLNSSPTKMRHVNKLLTSSLHSMYGRLMAD